MSIVLVVASADDADKLATLRVNAMRESLEAMGLFDPSRARARFLDRFDPSVTYKIMRGQHIAGFFVLKSYPDHLHLDHLYVANAEQGKGVGREVMEYVKSCSREQSLPVRLCALNKSVANKFYANHAFKVTHADKLDTYYEYDPMQQLLT